MPTVPGVTGQNPYDAIIDQQATQPPPPVAPVNPYDQILGDAERRRETLARMTALDTSGKDPEQYAEYIKLGQEIGLPVQAVENDPDQARQIQRLNRWGKLAQESPQVAAWLSVADNGVLAQDDLEVLSGFEKLMRGAGDTAIAFPAGINQFLGRGISGLGDVYDAATVTIGGGLRAIGVPESVVGGSQPTQMDQEGWWMNPANWFRAAGDPITELGDNAVPEERQNFATDVSGGLGQLIGQAVAYRLNPFAPVVMTAGAGAEGQATRAEEAGATPEQKATAVALGATITAAVEKIGLDLLLERVPPAIKNKAVSWIVDKTIAGGIEGGQEAVEQVANNLVAQMVYDPNAPLFEGVGESASVGAAVGVIARTIFGVRMRDDHRNRAKSDKTTLDSLVDLASQSTLRQRAPDKFRDLLARMSGDQNANVYVDAQEFNKLYRGLGVAPETAAAELGVDIDAYRIATVSDGEIAIPLANYVTKVDKQAHAALSEFAKLTPGGLTPAEAAMDDQTIAREADLMRAGLQAEIAGDNRIRDDVAGMLVGRYGQETAERYGTLMQAWFRTMGERSGVDGYELYSRYRLRVKNELPGLKNAMPVDTMLDPLIERLRAGDIPTERQARGATLAEFLSSQGGIKDEAMAGELRSLAESDRAARKGKARLVRDDAKYTLDGALEVAVEAGYLPEGAELNDLLDALTGELVTDRPTYSARNENQRVLGERQTLLALDEELGRRGIDLKTMSNAEVRKALSTDAAMKIAEMYEQSVWHGSPHRGIEQTGFSLQKIGTGEGAQAYGWGLYFAGKREIAEWYREQLSRRNEVDLWTDELRSQLPEPLTPAELNERGALSRKMLSGLNPQEMARWRELKDREDAYNEAVERLRPQGQLYAAEIPDDGDLLDWDAPLSEQPEKVQQALAAMDPDNYSPDGDEYDANETGQMIYLRLAAKFAKPAKNDDRGAPKGWGSAGTDTDERAWSGERAASEALLAAGIPGLRYLDGTSRGAGDGSRNYVIWDEGAISDVRTFYQSAAPKIKGQSTVDGNKHGLMPHLRTKVKVALEAGRKALFAQTTMNSTAPRQIAAIDEVLARHPKATDSAKNWNAMMADALASDDVPVPPYAFLRDLNGDGSFDLLSKLSAGQIADADHGFENAAAFREAYINGEISIEDTGRLFLWSFLSRGVSPYTQESLFIDSFYGIDEWIKAAANGTLESRLDEYKAWTAKAAPKGSGQPGAGATHNLNAFGDTFLLKMSMDAGDGTGRSRLQVLHDMMSDPKSTGKDVRRKFLEMGEGVGIDNKVVSFTLLVAGFTDVMVLDRVQIRQLWNDGRFDGINLYDGYKDDDGKAVAGSALSSITYGARGLLIYEAIERGLQKKITDLYTRLGRPEAASVGRYHWETWVASSQQEASHATIDAILAAAKGAEAPLQGVTAKEGEYGAYAYGARYGRDGAGTPYFMYSVPGGGDFRFSVEQFREFISEVKLPKNGVVPAKFKVTESGNGPWYNRPEVNTAKLGELAGRFGERLTPEQVRNADEANGGDQAVPGGFAADQSRSGSEEVTLYQSQQQRTPEFREWFGDSKVVDENGEPLVVYHGSPINEAIDQFNTEVGAFFSNKPAVAEGYMAPRGAWRSRPTGAMYPVHLSIKNPLVIDAQGKRHDNIPVPWKPGQWRPKTFGNLPKGAVSVADALKYAKENGYDGLIVKNVIDTATMDDTQKSDVYAVVSPDQIKSVFNDRPTSDPSILKQGPEQDTLPPRGSFGWRPDGGVTITLTEKADASTFIHESAHFFLEVMGDLTQEADVNPQIVADFRTLLTWAGTDPDKWFGMSIDEKRDAHERVARGFEAYVREGRAPSAELAGPFERFRSWLLAIYRSLRQLNVELSDDVRGVFDRMLATDAEIQRTEASNDYAPLFKEAAAAGMTEAQFQSYMDLMGQASREARDALAARAVRDVYREREAWWKDEADGVRKEVEEEVNRSPLYRAWYYMAFGTQPDGSPLPEGMEQAKLDRDWLIQQYGHEWVKKHLLRKRVYAVDGGADPDLLATAFGFESGDAMIQALANAEPRKRYVEAEVARRMRERHGDLMTDAGALEEAAQKAAHNSKRLQAIEAEMATLARLAGEPKGTSTQVRRVAESMVARMKLRDINPNAYLRAERKNAREAQQLAAKGQWAKALEAKRKQALNAHLYDVTLKAKEEGEKIRDFVKRFEKVKLRERLGKVGRLNEVDALLEAYDLRRESGTKIDRRKAQAELVKMIDAGLLTAPRAVVDRMRLDSSRTNYRELTMENLRGLRDVLRQLEKEARAEYEALLYGEKVDLDQKADEIAAAILAAGKPVDPQLGQEAPAEAVRRFGKQALNAWLRPAAIARLLDGGDNGPMTRLIIQPIRDAVARNLEPMKVKAGEDLAALYSKHYTTKEMAAMNERAVVPGLNMSLSRWDLISIALNWGNADNREALIRSTVAGRQPFTQAGIEQALATLTARDWAFVQDSWDYIDGYWSKIKAAQEARRGIAPPKVEALPFTMQTADGRTVTLRGGYYPLRYNGALDARSRQYEIDDAFERYRAGTMSAVQSKYGHNQERVGSGGQPVMLSMNVMHQHVNNVIYDLALWDAVNLADRLLKRQQVRDALVATGNLDVLETMKLWLKDVATGELAARNGAEKATQFLRLGFTKSKIGFNVMTALMGVTGFAQTSAVVGARWVKDGAFDYAKNPRQAIAQVMDQSDFMRLRYEIGAFNKDVAAVREAFRAGAPISKAGGFLNGMIVAFQKAQVPPAFVDAAFWMIRSVQMQVDTVTWLAGYHKAKAQNLPHDQAIRYADSIVENAQTSGLFSDRGGFERGTFSETTRQAEFVKIWTTLGSYMIAKGNIAFESYRRTDFRNPAQALAFMGDIGLLFFVEAILIAAIKGAWPDDEESWWWWATKTGAEQVAGTIPLVRELPAAIRGFGAGGGPLGAFAGDVGKVVSQTSQAEVDAALVKAYVNMIGTLTGAPSAQTNKMIDAYWREHVEGEDVSSVEYILGKRQPPQ